MDLYYFFDEQGVAHVVCDPSLFDQDPYILQVNEILDQIEGDLESPQSYGPYSHLTHVNYCSFNGFDDLRRMRRKLKMLYSGRIEFIAEVDRLEVLYRLKRIDQVLSELFDVYGGKLVSQLICRAGRPASSTHKISSFKLGYIPWQELLS